MIRRPTHIPRIARNRILDYVEGTGESCFTADDVCVEPLTLNRLVSAQLLKTTREGGDVLYYLSEGAALHQEARFGLVFLKIRQWSNSTRQYTFRPREVNTHAEILNSMTDGGLLEKNGHKYTVSWRSLVGDWQQMLKKRGGCWYDEKRTH